MSSSSSSYDEEINLKSNVARRLDYSEDVVSWEPKHGMEFDSIDEAANLYHIYSAKIGFSVRIRQTKKINDVVKTRVYCCSREGFRKSDNRDELVNNHRAETRCGCNAHLSLKWLQNGNYKIYSFEPEHNHGVVTPSKIHFLRSHRHVSHLQAAEADIAASSGMAPKVALEFMGRQAGGCQNLGFIPIDYKNYLRTKRKQAMKKGDAGAVMQYFQRMQLENPSSYYAIQLDEDELITNIFWADQKMMVDYYHFGDVVCFDTTYKTNREERPFAMFIGVNHHRQSVIFGATLLYDETTATFEWLFRTFLTAMSQKKPKTILTDQSKAMANAIASVLPETYHRLCVWHMFQNAAIKISDVFNKHPDFVQHFRKCVYDCDNNEDFVLTWNHMIEKFNLESNKWLKKRFEKKEKWSLAYGRSTFCANMTTTQRSESLNSMVKRYLNSGIDLLRFFEAFDRMLDDRRNTELESDFRMSQSTSYLHARCKILKHSADIYTPATFKVFENELLEIVDLEISVVRVCGLVSEYRIVDPDTHRAYTVAFNYSDRQLSCSCRLFEFSGILCKHALKLLEIKNIRYIPDQYILKRWTKKAKEGIVTDYWGSTLVVDPKLQFSNRYRSLCPMLVQVASKAAVSDETRNIVADHLGKLMNDVDEAIKKMHISKPTQAENFESTDTFNKGAIQVDEDSIANSDVIAKGIKQKMKTGGGRKRFISALEKAAKKAKGHKKTNENKKKHKASPSDSRVELSSCPSLSPHISQEAYQTSSMPQSGIMPPPSITPNVQWFPFTNQPSGAFMYQTSIPPLNIGSGSHWECNQLEMCNSTQMMQNGNLMNFHKESVASNLPFKQLSQESRISVGGDKEWYLDVQKGNLRVFG